MRIDRKSKVTWVTILKILLIIIALIGQIFQDTEFFKSSLPFINGILITVIIVVLIEAWKKLLFGDDKKD